MAITENLSTLKIHKLTKAQYERELAAGRIDENAIYLTPDEEIDLTPYETKDAAANKLTEAKSYAEQKVSEHNDSTSAHNDIRAILAEVKEDVDTFFKDADLTANAKDTLKELQSYIASDETAASEMLASIQKNSDDLSELTEEFNGMVDYANEKLGILVEEDSIIKGRIDTIEGIIGESKSIADDIEKAKQAAIEAARVAAENGNTALESSLKKYIDDEDAKIESRVGTLETNFSTIEGKLSAAEAQIALNKAAHEANTIAISARALQTDLDGVSGRVTTLEDWHKNFLEATKEEIQSL